jgi:hypothetical protein
MAVVFSLSGEQPLAGANPNVSKANTIFLILPVPYGRQPLAFLILLPHTQNNTI